MAENTSNPSQQRNNSLEEGPLNYHLFDAVFDKIGDPAMILHHSGIVIRYNALFHHVLDYDFKIIGRSVFEILPKQSAVLSRHMELSTGQDGTIPFSLNVWHKKNGFQKTPVTVTSLRSDVNVDNAFLLLTFKTESTTPLKNFEVLERELEAAHKQQYALLKKLKQVEKENAALKEKE